MSSSVPSVEASPTLPIHPKMNGNLARHQLNLSPLSISKHSVGTSTVATPANNLNLSSRPLLDLSRPSLNVSRLDGEDHGIYQMLASLALLCLLSLLMAFLALFFLQKNGPLVVDSAEDEMKKGSKKIILNAEEYLAVYQVSVALSTLTIALDLCCLFVCCIQFLFAIKLLKTPQGEERTNKFLKRSSHTRVVAIGGFFLSIPIFFTGVILFTFIQFHEVPAIVTSIVIGIGILFCGAASVHNVYLWQWEKTRASREAAQSKLSQLRAPDITAHGLELSTLV